MEAVEIARALGIRADEVGAMRGGVANAVYALGSELVLRMPRSPEFAADLRKEAAILPLVVAAGVRTAELVVAGPGYLVTRRLAGLEHTGSTRVSTEVGRELAKLHRLTTAPPEVPVDQAGDPFALVDRLAAEGWIDAGSARWLDEWFRRLPAEGPPRVLTHGDVAPQNLLVGPDGGLSGLIDWGDAALADPATDFAKLPFPQVPAALEGYRQAGAIDYPWEQRVLWHRLSWALARLENPAPNLADQHWSAPPAARLLDLLRFLAAGPPSAWPAAP